MSQRTILTTVLFSAGLLLMACSSTDQKKEAASTPFKEKYPHSTPAAKEAQISDKETIHSSSIRLFEQADFPLGVAVNAGDNPLSLFNQTANGSKQRERIEQHFSQLTAANIMKMRFLHPEQNNYQFEQANTLVDYARAHGKSVHGHTLIWHSDYQIPTWLKTFSGDKSAWLAVMKDHVQTIVAEFAGRVISWDVVNEAFNEDGSYRDNDSLFYQHMGRDFIEQAFINAKAADPTADLYYNDYNLGQGGNKLNAALAMVDDFIARGVPIDGIGFQMHIYIDWPSKEALYNSFKAAAKRGIKVKITELDVPFNNPHRSSYHYPNNYVAVLTETLAKAQEKRFCEIMQAYLQAVPPSQRGGVTVWGLWDSNSWLLSPNGLLQDKHADWPLLFDDSLAPKPAFYGVLKGLSPSADCE